MDPIARLVEEHETILAVAELAQREADAMRRGEPVKAAKVGKILDFIRTFADAYHHGKEEDLLFVRTEQRGFSRRVGSLGVMLGEHEQGRQLVRQAAAALGPAAGGDAEACGAVAEGLLGWAELIQGHSEKENHVLYPVAQGVLSKEDLRQLGEEFDRFEAGQPRGRAYQSWQFLRELAAECRHCPECGGCTVPRAATPDNRDTEVRQFGCACLGAVVDLTAFSGCLREGQCSGTSLSLSY